MARLAVIVGSIFAIVLAIVVGNRMSADAMAVVTGVVCGVLASIPTSLLLIWALGRRDQRTADSVDFYRRRQSEAMVPPVVVVNPGATSPNQAYPYSAAPSYGFDRPGYSNDATRQFRVMGTEETGSDTGMWH